MRVRLGLLFLFFLVAGCGNGDEPATPDVELELHDPAGESRTLTWSDLTQQPSLEGHGGYINTVGNITAPARYKGVAIAALMDLVGDGLGSGTGVHVVADDDYALTISSTQILAGSFPTFDPVTGASRQVEGEAARAIVAYERGGELIPADESGPLRLAFVSDAADQITDGHFWVKNVARLELVPLQDDWALRLEGAHAAEIDRSFYEAGAGPACHQGGWSDGSDRLWTGIPLWLLIGWVDDDNVHETLAFNRELALDAPYEIELVATDGARVTLQSDIVALDNGIVLANEVDGEALEEEHFPLRLVGDLLDEAQMVGRVEQIVLHLP